MTTNITPPRVAFLDPRTGAVSREWYLFFLSLFDLTGGGQSTATIVDLQRAPVSPLESVEAALGVLAQYIEALPPSAHVTASDVALPPAIEALSYEDTTPRYEPPMGASGTFTTVDLKTVSVINGIITGIV